MKRRPDSRNARQALAASFAMIASLVLLVVPMYTRVELKAGEPGQISHPTLLETVGPSIVVPLLIPVALSVLPLLIRGRAGVRVSVVAGTALAGFVVIGSASIGWFYVPALAAAVAAIVASTGSRAGLGARDY